MSFRSFGTLSTIYLSLVFLLFYACSKNDGFSEKLQGKWSVTKVGGIDVAIHNISIEVKSKTEYIMYDGCNSGGGAFSTGENRSIQFDYPALTYKYCDIYKTLAPGANITEVRKYSIRQNTLSLYDDNNNLLITAEKL